ncbi:hypothetical protein LDENG_00225410 [Lucifuga dentata]|nr:hypothetical protein LDENG_00225410 [Lucifuga dentata]
MKHDTKIKHETVLSIKIQLKHIKDYTVHFACLTLIYSIFIHVTLLAIISQSILLERIKPYFSKSLNLSKSNIQVIHPP